MAAMTVEAPKIFPGFENGRTQRWVWGAVLAVVIVAGAIRLRLAEVPLERDEGEYAYAGQLILQGVPPYRQAYFMKLPGTHALYALSMAVFGQTRAGIHKGLLVVNAASIVLIFLVGRKLADPVAGLIACAAYAIMSLSPCVLGTVAHATQFVVVFALAGIFVLCQAMESGRWAGYFGSGLFFGLAFLMKQPGALFAVFGAVLMVWPEWRTRPFPWQRMSKRGGLYLCGAVLPYAVTCLILWQAGEFAHFWFWTVTVVRSYGTALPLSQGVKYLHDYFVLSADSSMLLWGLGLAGMVCVVKDRESGMARMFIPALLGVSLVAVCLGMYFRPHYFVMLLPALALALGVALGVGVSSLRRLI